MAASLRVFVHPDQALSKPDLEWFGGEAVAHPESPERIAAILSELEPEPWVSVEEPEVPAATVLAEAHAPALLALYLAAADMPGDEALYPSVFFPRGLPSAYSGTLHGVGAFCFDTGTPLLRQTLRAASASAGCAETAARAALADGCAYALCRPPGHHAEFDRFGGYCYLNNAAFAARVLRDRCPRVAVLDIDLHHGNGTQQLFYRDPAVFVANIHGSPQEFFPHFSGFEEETGEGGASGTTFNRPLPRGTSMREYRLALVEALDTIERFAPGALVLSAGFDTFISDPIGGFELQTHDFEEIGALIRRALPVPTVVVQEGGYFLPALGPNARSLLQGLRG